MAHIMTEPGVLAKDIQSILGIYYKDQQFSYDGSGNVEYRGLNVEKGEPDDSETWEIMKFTYDASQRVARKQFAVGSWTGRAALF